MYGIMLVADVGSLQPSRRAIELACRGLRTKRHSSFFPAIPEVLDAVRAAEEFFHRARDAYKELPHLIASGRAQLEHRRRQREEEECRQEDVAAARAVQDENDKVEARRRMRTGENLCGTPRLEPRIINAVIQEGGPEVEIWRARLREGTTRGPGSGVAEQMSAPTGQPTATSDKRPAELSRAELDAWIAGGRRSRRAAQRPTDRWTSAGAAMGAVIAAAAPGV